MKRILFPGLRSLWIFLLIITLLPAMVFTLRTRLVARGEAENVTRENVLRVVRLAADRHQRLLESTQQVLFLLTRLPALRSGELEACDRLFADLIQQYPRYANLGIAQLNGSIAASGVPPQQPTSVADHSWFQRLAQNPDLESGDYHVDEMSGKPVVVLSHPVLDNAGRLRFIAFAALDLGWVNQVFTAAHFPAGSVMTLSDASGKILARTLDPEKWNGSPGPEAAILKSFFPERDATVESPGTDGIRRLYGFTQLQGRGSQAGAYVSVGVPISEAYAGADRIFPGGLLILAVTSAVAIAAMWVVGETFIGRGIRSLAETAKRLREGNLSARAGTRTGAAELRDLARAFDSMADSIQARAEDYRRAQAAAQESEAGLRLLLDQQRDGERRLQLTLDEAVQKISEHRQSEAALREEVRHLKEALRATAQEMAQHCRNEEALHQKETELKQCLDAAVTDIARLKVGLQESREELRQARLLLETATAEVAQRQQEAQILNQRVQLLEADLENETARSVAAARLESEARKREQQARSSLDAATAEISRRAQTDMELRESAKQIKIALETAASEVTELQDEVELLRGHKKSLREELDAAVARSENLQHALEAASADLERHKRAPARPHPREIQIDRQALAQKLNEEVADSLAGIKTGLESMHKMAGKSPLGQRLQESVNSLESARQKVRNLAKGLATIS